MNDARRWGLAMAGLLTQLNEQDHAVLGGGPATPDEIASRVETLKRDWDTGTREEMLKTLGWLANEGHRKAFNEASALDLQMSARAGVGQPIRAKVDEDTVAHMNFARKHRARIGHRSLLAWDAARLVTVAGWGALARLISEDEAWSYIIPMAQAVQRTYSSWDEFGKHHLLGREFWSGEWDGRFARCFLDMFDDPKSPWRTLPWTLDLSQHGLTVPLQPIVVEAPPVPGAPREIEPAPKSKTGLYVGLAIAGVVVLVGGGLAIAYATGAVGGGSTPGPAPAASATPSATPPPPSAPAATTTTAAQPTHPQPLPPHPPPPKKPH